MHTIILGKNTIILLYQTTDVRTSVLVQNSEMIYFYAQLLYNETISLQTNAYSNVDKYTFTDKELHIWLE